MTNEDKRLIEEAKHTTWEDCERLKSLAESEEAKREIEAIVITNGELLNG